MLGLLRELRSLSGLSLSYFVLSACVFCFLCTSASAFVFPDERIDALCSAHAGLKAVEEGNEIVLKVGRGYRPFKAYTFPDRQSAAMEELAALARRGDARANFALYLLSLPSGDKGEQVEVTNRNLIAAVKAGCREAAIVLAWHHVYGSRGFPASKTEALGILEPLVKDGFVKAMTSYAVILLRGAPAASERSKAVSLLRAGAKAGNRRALYRLAKLYAQGDFLPLDVEASIRYTKKAMKLGSPEAHLMYGTFITERRIEGTSLEDSLPFFKRAACLEVPSAMYQLSVLHALRPRDELDIGRAVSWNNLLLTRYVVEPGHALYKQAMRVKRTFQAKAPEFSEKLRSQIKFWHRNTYEFVSEECKEFWNIR